MKKYLFFFSVMLLYSSLIYSATINVPTDQPTIQAAINAANPTDVINVAAGTYNETLTFSGTFATNNLTIQGAGTASTFVTGGINFQNSGTVSGLTFKDFALSGAGGASRTINGGNPGLLNNLTFDNLSLDGDYSGSVLVAIYIFKVGGTLTITNCNIQDYGTIDAVVYLGAGLSVKYDLVFNNNTLSNCDGGCWILSLNNVTASYNTIDNIAKNIGAGPTAFGLYGNWNDSGSLPPSGTANVHHNNIFNCEEGGLAVVGFINATVADNTVDGCCANPANANEPRGRAILLKNLTTASITNNTVTMPSNISLNSSYAITARAAGTCSYSGNILATSGAITGTVYGMMIYGGAASSTMNIGNTSFSGNLPKYILTYSPNTVTVDATNSTFSGKLGSAMTPAELYATEDKIDHYLDNNTKGLVVVKSSNLFVTTNSGSIQRGIDAASSGWTVNVAAGIYNEHNILISKSLTLTGDPGDAQPGPGINAPIVDGQNLWPYGFRLANGVSNVIIQGFEIRNYFSTLTGDGDAIMAWVASTNHVTVNDNYMYNLSWNGVLVGNDGAIGDHSYWTIARNIVTDFGPAAFDASGYGLELTNTSHGVIEDNIVDAGSHFPGTAILITMRRSSGQDILIQRNRIRGMYDFAGINVQASTQDVTPSNLDDVRILNNNVEISGPASPTVPSLPEAALRIRNKLDGTVTNVVIHYNKLIEIDGYSIRNNFSELLNATCNWYGTVVPSEVAAKISGDVDFYPWLGSFPSVVCGVASVEKEIAKTLIAGYLNDDDKKIKDAANKATDRINQSLASEFWVDENHLTEKGNKVFDKEKEAVVELTEKILKWYTGQVATDAMAAIDHLITADKTLAEIAISEVNCNGGAKCIDYLAKANEEMDKALVEYGKGKYPQVIDHYKKAWENAMKAANKALPKESADLAEIPTVFSLKQNYPNPFNPTTTISYQVPITSNVEISIFNSLGEKVTTLVSEFKEAGNFEVQWNASNLSSGIYFYKMTAGEFLSIQKMILMK
jgi:hypothetical protein